MLHRPSNEVVEVIALISTAFSSVETKEHTEKA